MLKLPTQAILSEIMGSREINTYNIYSTDLGAKIEGSHCIDTFEEITEFILENAKEGDLVLTMGGGNVYRCANMIYSALEHKE